MNSGRNITNIKIYMITSIILDKFKDHELTKLLDCNGYKIFEFKKPGSIMYSQRWIISGGLLVVTGDCYDSIYRFGGNLTLDFLSECDLKYFSGKCTADKDGKNQMSFCNIYAMEKLKELAYDGIYHNCDDVNADEDVDSPSNRTIISKVIAETLDIDEDEIYSLFYVETLDECYDILTDKKYEFMFGEDAYDVSMDFFMEMSFTPVHHLAALTVANQKYPGAF